MKPNYVAIERYLFQHPEYVIESEVRIKAQYQEAIERLRELQHAFEKERSYRPSKLKIAKFADEAMQIITTLHSVIPARTTTGET